VGLFFPVRGWWSGYACPCRILGISHREKGPLPWDLKYNKKAYSS